MLNNTYFDLTVNAPHVSVGARFQWAKWPLPGYDKDFGGWGVPYIWGTVNFKRWQATAGDFYEQFGSGLILRTYQERSLGVDNAIRGGRVKVQPVDGLNITALAGKQRCYWEWNSSWLWGADAEWSLNETFKNKFNRNYGLTLGFSYVGKHDKAEQIKVTPSGSLVPEPTPGFNYYLNLPQNTAAFVTERFSFASSSFVISSSSFFASDWIYFSGSVVAMAYGVPAMFTRTLLTISVSPFYIYITFSLLSSFQYR